MQGKLKKRTKIILSVLGALLIALTVVLSVMCHSRTLHAGEVSQDGAYASVMADIENLSAANPRVVDMSMLGSHDANTYYLTDSGELSGEVKDSAKPFYALAGGLAYRYTKTQVSSIYDQLMQGVRYLHLKASYHDGTWYGSHSIIGGPIEIYIQDAIRFLKRAPGEFVVLQLHLMYDCGTTLSAFLAELFGIEFEGRTLGDFIPYSDIPLGELTYNDVTENGTQGGAIVMIMRSETSTDAAFYDIEKSAFKDRCYPPQISSKWYNRMDGDALVEAIGRQCEWIKTNYEKVRNGFRILQMQTTPTLQDAFETVGAWSLVCKAKTHNAKMIEQPAFDEWMQVMPIIECDFTTSANDGFNPKINEKIMAYNRELTAQLLREERGDVQ